MKHSTASLFNCVFFASNFSRDAWIGDWTQTKKKTWNKKASTKVFQNKKSNETSDVMQRVPALMLTWWDQHLGKLDEISVLSPAPRFSSLLTGSWRETKKSESHINYYQCMQSGIKLHQKFAKLQCTVREDWSTKTQVSCQLGTPRHERLHKVYTRPNGDLHFPLILIEPSVRRVPRIDPSNLRCMSALCQKWERTTIEDIILCSQLTSLRPKDFRQRFRQIYLWPHQLQKQMTKTVTFAAGKKRESYLREQLKKEHQQWKCINSRKLKQDASPTEQSLKENCTPKSYFWSCTRSKFKQEHSQTDGRTWPKIPGDEDAAGNTSLVPGVKKSRLRNGLEFDRV